MLKKIYLFIIIFLCPLCGCSAGKDNFSKLNGYTRALERTGADAHGALLQGSPEEKKALENFAYFYADFSEKRINSHLIELYAEDAYFRDGFKEVEGIDAIKHYFLKSVEPIYKCTFDIQDVARHDGEYYFRWVMTLVLKRDKSAVINAVGMSHVRFNKQSKIIFHQDYWDTSVVFERLPVVGPVIRWIKRKF